MGLPYLVSTSSPFPSQPSSPLSPLSAEELRLTEPKAAVVKEGLRLSSALGCTTSGRASEARFHYWWCTCTLTDVSRTRLYWRWQELTFPRTQTAVFKIRRIFHDNPKFFLESASYNFDRWLGEKGKELERWNLEGLVLQGSATMDQRQVSSFPISHI